MSDSTYFQTKIPDTPLGDDAGPNVFVSKEVFAGFVKEYRSFTREFAYGMLRELCLFAIKKDQIKEAGLICDMIFKLTGTVLPTLPKSTPEKPEYDFSDLLKISKQETMERLARINTEPPLLEPAPPLDEAIDPLTLAKFTKDKAFACYRELYLRAFRKEKVTSARITIDRLCGLRGFVPAKPISIGDLSAAQQMAKDDDSIPTDEAIHRYQTNHPPHAAPESTAAYEEEEKENLDQSPDLSVSSSSSSPSDPLPTPSSDLLFFDDDGMPQHIAEKPYAMPRMPTHMAEGKREEEWTEDEVLLAAAYHEARKLMLIQKAKHESGRPFEDYATDEQFEEARNHYALDEDHFYTGEELERLIAEANAGHAREVAAASVRNAQKSIEDPFVLLEKARNAAEAAKKETQQQEIEEDDDDDDSDDNPPTSRGPP